MLLPKDDSSKSVACSDNNLHCEHPCPNTSNTRSDKQIIKNILSVFFMFQN